MLRHVIVPMRFSFVIDFSDICKYTTLPSLLHSDISTRSPSKDKEQQLNFVLLKKYRSTSTKYRLVFTKIKL